MIEIYNKMENIDNINISSKLLPLDNNIKNIIILSQEDEVNDLVSSMRFFEKIKYLLKIKLFNFNPYLIIIEGGNYHNIREQLNFNCRKKDLINMINNRLKT